MSLHKAVEILTGGRLPDLDEMPFSAVRKRMSALCRELLDSLETRVALAGRRDRTAYLEAMYPVIAVAAFFDALDTVATPVVLQQLGIAGPRRRPEGGGSEQTRLPAQARIAEMMVPAPEPAGRYPEMRAAVRNWFATVAADLRDDVACLDLWSQVGVHVQVRIGAVFTLDLPDRAIVSYESIYALLRGIYPEYRIWGAGPQEERDADADADADCGGGSGSDGGFDGDGGFAGLADVLRAMTAAGTVDDRWQALESVSRAALGRPIVDVGDSPVSLKIPSLREAYVSPRFLAQPTGPGGDPSRESWWSAREARSDIDAFLAGYLTSSAASQAPLVILGQPGSGKSVFSRMLAATLGAGGYLPVLVPLREVPADGSIQDQVETAVRKATGEDLKWADLVRSAAGAVPVVILDGFDELLQATGTHRTDYLQRVQDFQQRESDQGRSVAVLVTSRTAVANRVRYPAGTIVLKLLPFDEDQVRSWLAVWNEANREHFRRKSVAALAPDVVLRQADLAAQPLLLLMLALFDADANALSALGGGFGRAQLYEGLLDRFARRELEKESAARADSDFRKELAAELDRLAVVAFAMFNRGTQWVSDEDLDRDLPLLTNVPRGRKEGLRSPITAGQAVVGRFFFVHEARASRDGATLHTYEFLHATFGEYLVARLTCRTLAMMMAQRQAVYELSHDTPSADDARLFTLLSWAPLANRRAVLEFVQEILRERDDGYREQLAAMLTELLRCAGAARNDLHHLNYRPRLSTVPARVAVYEANLVLLLILARRRVAVSAICGRSVDPVKFWHARAMSWRAFLRPEELTGVVNAIVLTRTLQDRRRDITLHFSPGMPPIPKVDLSWTFPSEVPELTQVIDEQQLLREAAFLCDGQTDLLLNAAEPLGEYIPTAISTIPGNEGPQRSLANVLIRMAAERPGPSELNVLLENELDSETELAPSIELALRVLDGRTSPPMPQTMALFDAALSRCDVDTGLVLAAAAAVLDAGTDPVRLITIMGAAAEHVPPADHPLVVAAWARIVELGYEPAARRAKGWFSNGVALLDAYVNLELVFAVDPGVVRRARWAMEKLGWADRVTWPAGLADF